MAVGGGRGVGRFTRLGIGVNLLTMTAGAVAVFVLAFLLSSTPGLWKRIDLTSHERNALAPQTLRVLETLPGEIEVSTFLKAEGIYADIVDGLDILLFRLLRQYNYFSGGKVTHRRYRVDENYGAARSRLQELEIKDDNNLVVVRAVGRPGRPKVLKLFPEVALITPARQAVTGQVFAPQLDHFRGEEALNSAILLVTAEKKPAIGFLAKHGEYPLGEQAKNEGLHQFAEALRGYGYEPAEVDLRESLKGLAELAVLVVLGPTSALPAEEWKTIRDYMDGGGRLLHALHPAFDASADSDFGRLLPEWGLEARLGVVREAVAGQVGIEECRNIVVLEGLSDLHPITRDLRRLSMGVGFPDPRGLEILPGRIPRGVTVMELASTGLQAWDDLHGGRFLYPDPGLEPVGRRVVAVAAEKELPDAKGRGRLVLLGTPKMACNYYFPQTRDFMLNSVSWLASRENLASVAPKPPDQSALPWSEVRRRFYFWVCVLIVPGTVLAAGVVMWFVRRR